MGRDAAQAGWLGKARTAACGLAGHHPKGRFCLPTAARRAVSTGSAGLPSPTQHIPAGRQNRWHPHRI